MAFTSVCQKHGQCRLMTDCVAKVVGIRRIAKNALLRPDLEKMFFAPKRKIFLQHYRP
jgi:hypothetical protein